MPTYNRADTIRRSIASVQAQTDPDRELVLVDDGSKDETPDVIAEVARLDSRIRYFRQNNEGVGGARNHALRESRGTQIAFLDSDDEWLPHHLELSGKFFRAFPAEHVFTSELWEDFGIGQVVKHYRSECSDRYLAMSRQVKSRNFELPPGETDDYMRVYETRQPIGEWARETIERTPYRDVFHYRGAIFNAMRWGWLYCLQPTVMTRTALEVTRAFDVSYPIGSDFGFLAYVCKVFPVNFFSLPGCIKYEYADQQTTALREGHIAKGKHANAFAKDMLRFSEELYSSPGAPSVPDIVEIQAFRRLYIGQTALENGLRDEALHYFTQAARDCPRLWQAHALKWFATVVRDPDQLQKAYLLLDRGLFSGRQLLRREVSPGLLAKRVAKRIWG